MCILSCLRAKKKKKKDNNCFKTKSFSLLSVSEKKTKKKNTWSGNIHSNLRRPLGRGVIMHCTPTITLRIGCLHSFRPLPGYAVWAGKLTLSSVKDWPQLSSVKELQCFLGFANFYRRFTAHFSKISAPLTTMLKNRPNSLSWDPAATKAFQLLKEAFCACPTLSHPNPNLPFFVEVDASTTGVGAVLSQRHGEPPKLHPCAFFFKKLFLEEQNYDIGNRELLAIKLALEEWRHWLEGAKHNFKVITDHRNPEYLRDTYISLFDS